MHNSVDTIKEKLRIEDVIGGYIKIEKSGSNFKTRCPFHNEKTPSFFISPDRGTYYCFGCGQKGDIFSFVQAFEGIDFLGSLRLLADKAGVTLELNNLSSNKVALEKEREYKIMEAATVFYEKYLEKKPEVMSYLVNRGLTKETIKEWRLGYAPDSWRELFEILKVKGISNAEMLKLGLVKEKEGDKNTVYDRFRGRVMFPLFDASERVIGFSGRILEEKPGVEAPKYLNSPETPIFRKSEVFYGIHKAKREMRSSGKVIIVEGQMDLLMAHQAGYSNTLATSGTALTSEHLRIISRFVKEVLLAYDADGAGRKASEKVYMAALSSDLAVKLISLKKGMDPADCIKNDLECWKQSLESPKHIIQATLDVISSESEKSEWRARVMKEVLPLVGSIQSAIERGEWVGKIAHLLNIKEEAIWEDVGKLKSERYPSDRKTFGPQNKFDRLRELYKRIFGIVWCLEAESESVNKDLCKEIREKLTRLHDSAEEVKNIEESLKSERDDLIFEVEVLIGKNRLQTESKEVLTELELEILQGKLAQAMKDLTIAEKAGEKKKADDLLLVCKHYSEKISELKR